MAGALMGEGLLGGSWACQGGIPAASTSVAAFVGYHPSGPVDTPVLLSSFADFVRQFGVLSFSRFNPGPQLSHVVSQFFKNGGKSCYAVRVSDHPSTGVIGNRAAKTGIYALERVSSFNLLATPGVADASLVAAVARYCQERQAFAILDVPASAETATQVAAYVTSIRSWTDHVALYFPWLLLPNPVSGGKPIAVPPSGTVAGIIAATDASHGVWKSPAGVDAEVQGATGLVSTLTAAEEANVSALGVNCLRAIPQGGPVVWGARTMAGSNASDPAYKYVPVRRTALFIESSLRAGLQWVAFEPNTAPTWAKIRLATSNFMQQLFVAGAFQGTRPNNAYFVKCDSTTISQQDISQGILNVMVGFAPLKPAEFVVIQISLLAKKP